jgi:cytochrome oxidase Cu insertion factor (SCO1/SenC/PrrC family)
MRFAHFLLALLVIGASSLWSLSILAEDTLDIDTIIEDWQITMLETPVPAPEFSLTSMDGDTKTLEDFQGQLVFLNFWTTW